MNERILVVEDEATLRGNISRYLERRGQTVAECSSAEEALDALASGDGVFDVAVLDVRLPGMDGLTLASELRLSSPDTMILVMTAYGTVESVIEALRAGVYDYILKPVILEDLASKVDKLCEHRRLVHENTRLRQKLAEQGEPTLVLARSRAMKDLLDFARQVASTQSTVLIEGESGSGKEVVARQVHAWSARSQGPFVAVNMSAIPDHLVESTLFGHEKGAFTGADAAREGLFRVSTAGTLFLDEIGEVPTAVQAKLLRAIETKEILPVGSDTPAQVSCRVLAATNRDLRDLIQEKRFRQDLYYRVSVLRLRVPPLRERMDDIPLLAHHFLKRHAQDLGKPIAGFESGAVRKLLSHPWPGNVRELANVVERATLVCQGQFVTVADLPPEVVGTARLAENGGIESAVADFERALIASTLDRVQGDRREAARVLGISLATLYRRLERLGLRNPGPALASETAD